jgi:hypothetical protein
VTSLHHNPHVTTVAAAVSDVTTVHSTESFSLCKLDALFEFGGGGGGRVTGYKPTTRRAIAPCTLLQHTKIAAEKVRPFLLAQLRFVSSKRVAADTCCSLFAQTTNPACCRGNATASDCWPQLFYRKNEFFHDDSAIRGHHNPADV